MRGAVLGICLGLLAGPGWADGNTAVLKCVDKAGHVSFASSCPRGSAAETVKTGAVNVYDHSASQRAYDNTPKWTPPPPRNVVAPAPEPVAASAPPPLYHSGCRSVITRSNPDSGCFDSMRLRMP